MRLFSIIKWPFVSTETDEFGINKFTDWFGSIPGFKQQTAVMLVWILIVVVFPSIDPNMFHLMAVLTIYSAITQPMIAIQNARSTALMMKILQSQIHELEAMHAMIERGGSNETH